MSALRDNLRGIFKVILFILLTAIFFLPQLLIGKFLPRHSLKLPVTFHKLTLRILSVKVTVIGKPEKAMLISNHLSWLDIVVLGSITPLRFIAKNDVASWFIFGRLAKLQNTIFVDRHSRLDIIASKAKIEQALLNSPVVLFAEGTTSDGSCVLPMNSSFVVTPAQAVALVYDKPSEVAWFGDMELLPHLWQVFKQPSLSVKVAFLETYTESTRKIITQMAETTIRNSYHNGL